jgi:putative acetyltransferase
MIIRPFEDADFDQLSTAWRAASVVAHDFLSLDFLEAEVVSIRDVYLAAAESWVAVDDEGDGKVVGFLALMGSEVGALFVHPGHWKKGIGRTLMAKAAEGREVLTLDVFEKNEVGRAFFGKFGFLTTDSSVHEETGNTVLRLELKVAKGLVEHD